MKPDIVFFHESLPDDFHNAMAEDKDECDLLIVIGSSLKVKPVALIPTSIPANVPQILINREHLSHMTFDVELLGDCDVIIQELCHRLGVGWSEICVDPKLNELKDSEFQELCSQKMNRTPAKIEEIHSNRDNVQAIDNSSDLSQSTNGSVDEKLNITDILPGIYYHLQWNFIMLFYCALFYFADFLFFTFQMTRLSASNRPATCSVAPNWTIQAIRVTTKTVMTTTD